MTPLEQAARDHEASTQRLEAAQRSAGRELARYRTAESLPRHALHPLLNTSPTRVLNMELGINLTPSDVRRYMAAVDTLAKKRNINIKQA